HRGMDAAAAVGTTALAPASGVIAFRGTVADRPLITIDHGDGLVITLEPVASALSPGEAVAAGQPIGTVATGGHVRPGTVHVGIRAGDGYLDPRPFFAAPPRAVLYPCCAALS
ncbi:MAG: M23 family metallopeptidase, partial [Microbacterium sp.]